MRVDQLARIQVDQLPRLPLEVKNSPMREPFQPRSEPALRTPGALGYPAQFPLISGEKADYQIRLFQRIGSKDNGFAYASRHNGVTGNFQVITVRVRYSSTLSHQSRV